MTRFPAPGRSRARLAVLASAGALLGILLGTLIAALGGIVVLEREPEIGAWIGIAVTLLVLAGL